MTYDVMQLRVNFVDCLNLFFLWAGSLSHLWLRRVLGQSHFFFFFFYPPVSCRSSLFFLLLWPLSMSVSDSMHHRFFSFIFSGSVSLFFFFFFSHTCFVYLSPTSPCIFNPLSTADRQIAYSTPYYTNYPTHLPSIYQSSAPLVIACFIYISSFTAIPCPISTTRFR